MRALLLNIFVIAFVWTMNAQPRESEIMPLPDYTKLYSAIVHDGDTIILYKIPKIVVMPPPQFKSQADWRRYWRLVYNVKKVYPYAQLINYYYYEVEETMKYMDTKEREKYIKRMEKYLRQRFEKELVNLTVTQGIILVKLVSRQTGKTTYQIIKDFKGTFNAQFWQTLARLFGNNLKATYDPIHNRQDRWIEYIISQIEAGRL